MSGGMTDISVDRGHLDTVVDDNRIMGHLCTSFSDSKRSVKERIAGLERIMEKYETYAIRFHNPGTSYLPFIFIRSCSSSTRTFINGNCSVTKILSLISNGSD